MNFVEIYVRLVDWKLLQYTGLVLSGSLKVPFRFTIIGVMS